VILLNTIPIPLRKSERAGCGSRPGGAFGGGAQVLDLGYLSGGVYLLQLADGQTLKIIKE